jgi:hypothetical protein
MTLANMGTPTTSKDTTIPGDHAEWPQTGARTASIIRTIASTIQDKPKKWGETSQGSQQLEPWYSYTKDGVLHVTVPSDIESYADDPGCLAAIAALEVLKPVIEDGLPMKSNPLAWVRCHNDVDQYYLGIAAAFKVARIQDYPSYSGWFGKGYNLIAHRRLVKAGLKPWFLRGSETALRKVWSHKAWGDKLPSGYKHLEILVRLAADALILVEKSATTWVVPLQTLKGTKVKKHLALEKVGFLLQTDIDALSVRFKDGIETFTKFNARYSDFTFGELCELEIKIKKANQAVSELERTSESIIDHRAAVLYPPQIGRKKKSQKAPLKERLSKIEVIDFVNRFTPSEACGISRFTTSWNSITPEGQETWSLDAGGPVFQVH